MTKINYLKGNAVYPERTIKEGNKIICQVCNDIGAWGAGFVLAISGRWAKPEQEYREWAKNQLTLGEVQFSTVETDIQVANMIGQHNVGLKNGIPLRYEAVRKALLKVTKHALQTNASVHMPRIGCGLAGGEWEEIEKIINDTLCKYDIQVYVYDFE